MIPHVLLSGVGLLLQHGPRIMKFGHDLTHPGVGVLPKVRGDAVEALNSVRGGHRTPWTAEGLFLFFAAFIRTRSSREVEWTRPTGEILTLLTRGLNGPQLDKVGRLLSAAMAEVPDMIRLVPSLELKPERIPAPGNSVASSLVGQTLVGLVLLGPLGIGAGMLGMGAWGVKSLREDNTELAILGSIAESLLQAGLSTAECRVVFREQGLADDLSLKALQFA